MRFIEIEHLNLKLNFNDNASECDECARGIVYGGMNPTTAALVGMLMPHASKDDMPGWFIIGIALGALMIEVEEADEAAGVEAVKRLSEIAAKHNMMRRDSHH
jgi:hypothetical protein